MTNGVPWKVRVASRGRDHATVYVRGQQFDIGAPLSFDPQHVRVTALEYLLGSIGGDLVNGLRSALDRRRIPIDHIEAVITGDLNNPLAFFGVIGEPGHPGLQRVTVQVYVSTVEPEARVLPVWDEVLQRSPAANTFRHAIAFELHLQVVL